MVIKGDRQSIGYKKSDLNFNFTNHTAIIRKGMCFYLLSDGFADQLGEKSDRRFGTKRLKNLLRKISYLSFDEQKKKSSNHLSNTKAKMKDRMMSQWWGSVFYKARTNFKS